jgi:hypothetical protein
VSGGVRPYAISWDWGDGQTSTSTTANVGEISASHTYGSAGTYRSTIRVTDGAGTQAALQLAVVVNGMAAVGTGGSKAPLDGGVLLYVWPLLIMMFLIVFSFWLGERHKLAMAREALSTAGSRA